MRIVVISDLHISSGPLDDFDPAIELALIEFLQQIAASGETSELVINGDFLDFVQAEPWHSKDFESQTNEGVPLCFTEEQSVEKLRKIAEAHAPVFIALGTMLRSPAIRRLTVLPGNHDADLFWPQVRAELRNTIAGQSPALNDKLRFCLEEQYRAAEFPRLWIEHGHQRDPCNSFESGGVKYWSESKPPIFFDEHGAKRLLECVGTRFMLKFMNDLDARYPFVDNVKPFSKFVRMFLVSSAAPGFGPIKAAVSCWALACFLRDRLAESPKDLVSTGENPRELPAAFARLIRGLSAGQTEHLTKRLQKKGFMLNGMPVTFYVKSDEANSEKLLTFLANYPEILEGLEPDEYGLMSKNDSGLMTLGAGFVADETTELKRAAIAIISSGRADGVVMGHTHEPVDPSPTLNYVNTGSWTRYLKEPSGYGRRWSWDLLKKTAYQHFPYELGYGEIRVESAGSMVRKVFRSGE